MDSSISIRVRVDCRCLGEAGAVRPNQRLLLIVIRNARKDELLPSSAPVARVADVASGTTRPVVVDGIEVLLCNVDGRIHAIEDVCTHDGWPLDQGELDGVRITCPRHGAVFDVTTGAVLALPAVIPVRTFCVDVEDGSIYVDV
ncbi:MAG: non-heme iron oxygenase ferredoxin subunit [Candidatus Eremiobacteraeota bacterium]|nr:non-heme iron oxygenase ferredoxin subunit [Candidatus Eremiobacteraeota bacterium]MBC5804828.1 non-heme iron oxygenase ferredoxin subunit [Candidatus Eremiobacteraeota bacterium]MBC5824611.1 non-heme iron oxygenase ferredoxin subunit [Candidatus Eremiobacteraeota bacterium]